ncbi:hypothetical protein B0H14DRAFT_3489715 [Mycena olivaceomarginata]|nr:hypothetical protein B0H14DRAFT_3489715 [Mycena olivaceomarginata]
MLTWFFGAKSNLSGATSLVRARLPRHATGTTPDASSAPAPAHLAYCRAVWMRMYGERLHCSWIGVLIARVMRTYRHARQERNELLGTAKTAPLMSRQSPRGFRAARALRAVSTHDAQAHPASAPALISHHLSTRARHTTILGPETRGGHLCIQRHIHFRPQHLRPLTRPHTIYSSSRTAPRSRVRTTHSGAGIGPAACALLPSSSRAAPRSRVWTHGADPRSDDTRQRGRRSHSPCVSTLKLAHGTHPLWMTRGAGIGPAVSHAPTLELARGTPIPCSDDTWQRHWSPARAFPPSSSCTAPLSHVCYGTIRFGRHTAAAGVGPATHVE